MGIVRHRSPLSRIARRLRRAGVTVYDVPAPTVVTPETPLVSANPRGDRRDYPRHGFGQVWD